jgi:hypothetical protein
MRAHRPSIKRRIALLLLVTALPAYARAQECFTRLYAENQDYVEATVDTHGIESNVYLMDVQIEVTFNFSGKQQTSKWDFTDRETRYLNGDEVYRRYFRVPENMGSAPRIVAGSFTFLKQVKGATAQAPSKDDRPRKPLNPGTPPSGGRVIGETPPSAGGTWK